MNTKTKLSAVIACYKDALAVPQMYQRLTAVFIKLEVDYEIIFVNDGSPDDARTVLAVLAQKDKKVVVINHARNFGSQSAFTSGMKLATGDAIILLDGDLQDPPELIEPFVEKWREGYDVVYGERVGRVAPLFLRWAYKAFYRIFSRVAYVHVPLDAGDFSLLDRRVVEAINSLPENNRFLRGLRAWVGYRQIGVAYVRPERAFGQTTNSWLRNFAWARKAIFSFSYAPLDLITLLALGTMTLAFISICVELALRLLVPSATPSGFTTVIIIVLFLGAIQLLCLAIIGSYLEHIYDEVKRRPPYIVESVINRPAELRKKHQVEK